MSHFPFSHLLLFVTGSYPCHLLQSADCASLKKYMALLGCVSSTLVGGDRNRDHSCRTESLFMAQVVRDLGSHLRKLIGAYM